MQDICISICNYLRNMDKLNFFSVTQNLHSCKSKIKFTDSVFINRITNIWYFDQFTNIKANNICTYPKSITTLTIDNIRKRIPDSVTHLTFGYDFDYNIKNIISEKVTPLTCGY